MAQSSQNTVPSVPVASVQRLQVEPSIDDHTQRRRLVFIQRFFEREGTTGNFKYSAKLRTGVRVQQEQFKRWLPWMTSFDREERYNNLSQESMRIMGKDPEFRKFSVILSSVMFLSSVDGPGMNTIIKYFRETHHKQAGFHIFVVHSGHLSLMVTSLVQNPGLGDKYTKDYYIGDLMAPIHSIYPAIRHEWQTTGEDNVVYGLSFEKSSNAQTVADMSGRYYHRFSDYCLKANGVNELTKNDILEFKDRIGNDPFTALYVCAGAKLVVVDPYSIDNVQGNKSGHSRSLIQQGGVVIFKGVIRIRFYVKTYTARNVHTFKMFSWPQFSRQCITDLKGNNPNCEGYRQTVIFLPGIDSQHNSIAWSFVIDDTNVSMDACLAIPIDRNRNTFIEAISEGKPGLDEIIARMEYEQLHDSVLTEHRTDFIPVQNDVMLRKILNVNGERTIIVDNTRHLTAVETQGFIDKNLPKEFNITYPISEFLRDPDNEFYKYQLERKTRAAPPPMYPPIHEDSKIIYWPSSGVPIANVDFECYKYDEQDNLSILIKHRDSLNAREYKYCGIPDLQAYHYERMTGEDDQKHWLWPGFFHIRSRSPYRIGVDGWMWRKVRGERADGEFKPIYYEKHIVLKPLPGQN